MALFKLTTPKDDAWKVMECLGQEDVVQFLNMNENMNVTDLQYMERIKLCDETERRTLLLINTCREYNIKINKPPNVEGFARNISQIEGEKKKSHDLLFDAIENDVRDCEKFVMEQRETIDEIKSNIAKLDDYHEVIKFIKVMMNNLDGAKPAQGAGGDAENPASEPLIDSTLQFIAGTVRHDEMERMKRMLFRVTRGKALTHFRDFVQDNVEKVAYLVVFSAAGGNRERVQKVCDSFMGQRFEIPSMETLDDQLTEIGAKIMKSRGLYDTSVNQLKDYLFEKNSSTERIEESSVSRFEIYKWFVAKEKAIYNALNMLYHTEPNNEQPQPGQPLKRTKARKTYIGYLWIPTEKEALVAQKLAQFSTTEFTRWRSDGQGPVPPTSYKTNDMLLFHQITVDTYKFATYGEINPAPFQIVTFPFLFAVMYGDYGHGSIFFLLGLVLCAFNSKLKENHAMKGLLATRYFWLMMGFFSMYQGLIYNEFFAVPNDWFGTCFNLNSYDATADDPRIDYKNGNPDCVYAFGMDPTWTLSSNYLTFTNNIKEKLSVIIAYFHLNFGIFLQGMNCVYFGDWKKLSFNVITGFFIFLALIGYMIVLIYVKWWVPVYSYAPVQLPIDPNVFSISTSPSIINLLIGDVMGMTGFAEPNNTNLLFFSSQQDISDILVYIMFACLPTMLCAIPCIAICCGPKHHHEDVPDEFAEVKAVHDDEQDKLMGDSVNQEVDDVEKMLQAHAPKDGGDHGAGEIFIHQVIETIEFVLGCISNTASYLRLWALSLAHGQLGEVFLTIFFGQPQGMFPVKDMSVAGATFYFFFLGFGYMFAIMCVLLMMDCLEVFLHTMRLHWVEFMGRFYQGTGIAYKPFSFTEVFEKELGRSDSSN